MIFEFHCLRISVAANIKNSPKYFTCGDKHDIWHTYLSDNTVSKIIIGHRDFFINSQVEIDIFQT
jgi:hypothetical protein